MKPVFLILIGGIVAAYLTKKTMVHENPVRTFAGKATTIMVRLCSEPECDYLYPLFVFNSSEIADIAEAHCPKCAAQNSLHFQAIHIDKVEVIEGELKARAAKVITR